MHTARFGRATSIRTGSGARARFNALLGVLLPTLLFTGVFGAFLPSSASADSATVTYSATLTVPAPPASNFAGASGGGDGWGVALSSTQVFNVFHHSGSLTVNCHNQSDASACWTGPKTITDGSGNGFSTSIGPGLFLAQDTGALYVPVVRTSDATAGVACIDTTQPVTATVLFCGFTPLSAVGQGSTDGSANGLSAPVQVGSKWYFYNEVFGTPTGDGDALLCFDLNTKTACAGQPFAVDRGGVDFNGFSYSYPIGAAGSDIFLQVLGSSNVLACFDTSTNAACSGSWPVTATVGAGAPYPLMNGSSQVLGICLPDGTNPCFDFTGASVASPPGLATAMGTTVEYNGPAVSIGPRVYIPDASTDAVNCYDYNQQAACANFPKTFQNLGLLYTVNPDPQRPTCLWVNADDGSAQIQNFDAFTGGACGAGAIRVLASSIVVPSQACIPATYQSLQVLSPAPGTYSPGSIDFEDASGNPIVGVGTHALDGTGTADLTDLHLSTQNALPQFLITLANPTAPISEVQVKLTWTGTYSTDCVKGDTLVTGLPSAPPPNPAQGYRLAGLDDGVFAFGNASFAGSLGGPAQHGAAVGIATTPSGAGYYIPGTDGSVLTYGDAVSRGSVPAVGIHISDVKGIAVTPSGNGYWLVEANGGVFSFGDAAYHGSAPGLGLAINDVVGIAATPSGNGYWLLEANGGVLSFGDAAYHGSIPGLGISVHDIVAFQATASGNGYRMVEANGGVFDFGDAFYHGSAPGLGIHVSDVRAILTTPSGNGYWEVEANGGVFSFGDASFEGSLGGSKLNAPIVGMTS